MKPEYAIRCPKCDAVSGDNWSQCEGSCPMPMSPHFDASLPTAAEARRRVGDRIIAEIRADEDPLENPSDQAL